MSKKNKKETYPKNYKIIISRNGLETNFAVELTDTLLMSPSKTMTINMQGITKNNLRNSADLFNMAHIALRQIEKETFPIELDQLAEYADAFVQNVALDGEAASEINNGGIVELTIPSLHFYAAFPASEKARTAMDKEHKLIYKFGLYEQNGERTAFDVKKKQPADPGRAAL